MHISLDEIMRREKFTDDEKALVGHAGPTQAERVKVITDIKVAKSNERYSDKIMILTYFLVFAALLDVMVNIVRNPQGTSTMDKIFGTYLLVLLTVLGIFVWYRRS
jgi:hypothetical protein